MEIFRSAADIEAAIGKEIGPTDWLVVEQSRIDGFADATGDHQWIHVDPERAAAGPFGATIAHGFLTLSLIPHFVSALRDIRGATMGINYGLERVRFPAPVPVGSRLRARMTVTDVRKIGDGAVQFVSRVTVETEGADKPACVADTVTRYYFPDAG
jgi:acyl dehydratase